MRNIFKLVKAIKKEVPNNRKDKSRFFRALDDVLDSAKYRAPEAYIVNFDQLSEALGGFLNCPPKLKWEKRIADIFADKIKS